MKKIHLILLLCLLPLLVCGQSLKTSYFSEYSSFRNRLNPAFMPRSNYVGFAALDNLGVGITSNIGLSTLLYPSADGKLMTFMHPDVSAQQFLKALPKNPFLDVDVDTDILHFGFYSSATNYWTFSLGVKVDLEANLPSELFRFLKLGADANPQVYHIDKFNVTQNAYAELAVGYTHNFESLVPGLRFGAKAKFLASADRLDVRINSIDLTMSSDQWIAKTDAHANVMVKGFDVTADVENGENANFDLNPIGGYGPAGYGAAFDFGLEYRLKLGSFFDSIRFSAAVTDLGFIAYNKSAIQQFKSSGEFTYNGFQDIDPSQEMDFNTQLEEIQNNIMKLANLHEVETKKSLVERLKPQVFIGVELPFLWNQMSFGVLYNTKFGYSTNRNELTLALSARPGKTFNFTASYSMLNNAKSMGFLIETTPRGGINLFLGCDYIFFNVMPQYYIPVDAINFNLRMGFNIAFGNKHVPKRPKKNR